MSQELFVNGVNADGTVGYEIPIDSEVVARAARGDKLTKDELNTLRLKKRGSEAHFGVAEGVDAEKLDSAGWGVIFPAGLTERSREAIREALKPLLDHRRSQAGETYQEYMDPESGVRVGETKVDFLKRYGRLLQLRPGWRDELQRHGFTHALLPNDQPLVEALQQLGWRRIYGDQTATLLVATTS